MNTRFPMLSLWLLTLIPGNAVVLLDLQHGVVRPTVWFARFVPALLVLAVSLFLIRTRSELNEDRDFLDHI